MSRPPYDMTRLQSVDGGAGQGEGPYASCLVGCSIFHRPEAQHTPCPFSQPPQAGRPLYPLIDKLRREEVLVPTPGDGSRHHSTAPNLTGPVLVCWLLNPGLVSL
jgi:hypothetical protein